MHSIPIRKYKDYYGVKKATTQLTLNPETFRLRIVAIAPLLRSM